MSTSTDRPAVRASALSVLLLEDPRLSGKDTRPLADVVAAWNTALGQLGQPFEIMTWAAPDGGESPPAVRVLAPGPRDDPPPADGCILRAALAAARYPLFGYFDCRRFSAADLTLLLDRIDLVDIVSGVRGPKPPWSVWLVNGVYRLLALVLFGIPIEARPVWTGWHDAALGWLYRFLFGLRLWKSDSRCRLFRRSIFSRIPIQSESDFVHVEILAKANFLNGLMDEVVLPPAPVPPAKSTWTRDFWRVLKNPDFGPTAMKEGALPPNGEAAAGAPAEATNQPPATAVPPTSDISP